MQTQFKGTPIHYSKSGAGKALVLLHGFLGNSSMWDFLTALFSEKYLVLSIDLLGHGKSGSVAETHSMELMAEAVKNVLDTEEIKKAAFAGHSMGGYVTLAFAEQFPERLGSVVLLNSTTREDSLERKENRDRSIALVEKNKDAFVSMAIANLFAEKRKANFLDAIESLKHEAMPMPVEGITAALAGMKTRKDRTKVFQNVSSSKYIIAGKEDPVISAEELKEIAIQTKSPFFELEGGHMSYIENRKTLMEIFRQIFIL